MKDSKDIFKPDNKSVKELFERGRDIYHMPIYQRPYAWDRERVEQLLYDILESYNNNKADPSIDKNYFLGSIVVVDKSEYQDVVDGQQRLTTLIILFRVLQEFSLNDLTIRVVNNAIRDNISFKVRLKLTNNFNNNNLFMDSIIDDFDLSRKKSEIKNNKFMQAASYLNLLLKESLNTNSDFYISDLNDFVQYMFNNVTIIKVVCYDETFAIKLFGVLNDRGLDLTSADIIKAYMMEPMVGKSERLNLFIDTWDSVEKVVSITNDSMRWMLSIYFYYINLELSRKPLQDEFKVKIKKSDPQKLIVDIKKFSEKHYDIINSKSDIYISMLKHLNHNIYWKTILVTAKHIGYEDFEKLKKLITKYYYISWIAGGTVARIKQTSSNILKMVKSHTPVENTNIRNNKTIVDKDIKTIVLENLIKYKDYKDVLENKSIDNEKWICPVLLMLEYSNEKINHVESLKNIYVEHILPVGWNDLNLNWKSKFSDSDARKSLNCLGNLTLISGKNNLEKSNVNYENKKVIYKGKGVDGNFSFNMTSNILDDYDDWTVENVDFRNLYLLDEITKILDI